MLWVEIRWEFMLWYTECSEREGKATGTILNHILLIKFIKGLTPLLVSNSHVTSRHNHGLYSLKLYLCLTVSFDIRITM